jgi:hypothetical protein
MRLYCLRFIKMGGRVFVLVNLFYSLFARIRPMAFDSHDKIQSKSQLVDLYLTSDGQLRVVAVEGSGDDRRRERDQQGVTLISRSGVPTLASAFCRCFWRPAEAARTAAAVVGAARQAALSSTAIWPA